MMKDPTGSFFAFLIYLLFVQESHGKINPKEIGEAEHAVIFSREK